MIGFITFDQVNGKKNNASSRIRYEWPAKYLNAEIFKYGKKYEAVIFEKAYLVEYARLYDGIKILDMCDPDFLFNARVVEMIQEVDAITCSTETLANMIRQMTDKPVEVIPDRLELSLFKEKKNHKGKAKEVVWFGYSHNSHVLDYIKQSINKLDLNLSIISDEPVRLNIKGNIRFTKWDLKTFNNELLKSDMVVCPNGDNRIWTFKSNNRTTTSWALGMPVATNYQELVELMDEKNRTEESKKRLIEVKENYNIKQSAKQINDLIERLKCGR